MLITLSNIITDPVIHQFTSTVYTSLQSFVWLQGRSYATDGMESGEGVYSFAQTVLSQGKEVDGVWKRFYYFIGSTKIGSGQSGQVFNIEMTLEFGQNLLFEQSGYTLTKRVVKIQQALDWQTAVSIAFREFGPASLVPHLAMQAPFIGRNMLEGHSVPFASYLVMDEMPRKSLWDIIDEDWDGTRPLSVSERFYLINAVLSALKLQVAANDIIHCDLKPDNMMVELNDMDPSKPIVRIVDMASAHPATINQVNYLLTGAVGFLPPEAISVSPMRFTPINIRIGFATDVFSVARVIAMILKFYDLDKFQDNLISQIPDPVVRLGLEYERCLAYFRSAAFRDLTDLFKDAAGFNKVEQKALKAILQDMLRLEPEQRITLDEAIERFGRVSAEYFARSNPLLIRREVSPAPRIEILSGVLFERESFDLSKALGQWLPMKSSNRSARHSIDDELAPLPGSRGYSPEFFQGLPTQHLQPSDLPAKSDVVDEEKKFGMGDL